MEHIWSTSGAAGPSRFGLTRRTLMDLEQLCKMLQYEIERIKSEALVLLRLNVLYCGAVRLRITEWTSECVRLQH